MFSYIDVLSEDIASQATWLSERREQFQCGRGTDIIIIIIIIIINQRFIVRLLLGKIRT